MNEYRIQRLKEELTYAQQRNKHQKQQLANYKKVHEKDLKEIEKLNNDWNKLKEWANKPQVYICNYHIVDKINEIEKRDEKEC